MGRFFNIAGPCIRGKHCLLSALAFAACASARAVEVAGCGPVDLSLADGVEFEARVGDWSAVSWITGVFDSRRDGDRRGYYMTHLTGDELPQVNDLFGGAPSGGTNWTRLVIGKRNLYNIERDPPGWAHVRNVSFSFRLKKGCETRVEVRNVRPVPATGRDVAVVFPEQGLEHNSIGIFSSRLTGRVVQMRDLIVQEGLGASIVSLRDLAAGRVFPETKLAVFPFAVRTPEIERTLADFAAGGRVKWVTERTRFDDLGGTLSGLVPDFAAKCAAAKAARARELARLRAEIAQMPSVPDEVRVLDCHTAWGASGKGEWQDWETVASNAAACGITHLLVNLSRGPFAAYESKVLRPWPAKNRRRDTDALVECRTACRRHGLKLFAWRCCWSLPRWLAPKEVVDEFMASGRIQRNYRGELIRDLCPSHPDNIREEIESQVELAELGVDGVHYDYIRFPNGDSCYCDRCRGEIEKRIGVRIANWPKDVMGGGRHAKAWSEFRKECIGRVVRAVAERVRRDHPGVKLSASVLSGDVQGVADGCGQDWTRWCREGWLDVAIPMDYAKDPEAYRKQILGQKAADCGKAEIWPNMGPSCWPTSDPVDWLTARQIQITRACGFRGWAIFELDERIESMLRILRTGPTRP